MIKLDLIFKNIMNNLFRREQQKFYTNAVKIMFTTFSEYSE